MAWKRPKFLFPTPRLKRLANLKTERDSNRRTRLPEQIQGEAHFLSGRHSRTSETARLMRIMVEFIRGFRAFHKTGPTVTVFGSARFNEGHPYYELSRKVGSALALEGFTVMTGGGPGIMEGASRGAKEVGGLTVGCTILLPNEKGPNHYLDRFNTFYYFFVRKVMLVKYSYGYVILPGGFGTLDEMTEALVLIQTGRLYDFPIILMGKSYWSGFHEWLKSTVIQSGAAQPEDLNYLYLTDDPQEAVQIITRTIEGLGMKLQPLQSHVE